MNALSFGEIIWDTYIDRRTLGGAPLNVAGHISRLGGKAAIISAVGRDDIGRNTIMRLEELGVDTEYVYCSDYPTGQAFISLENGIPSYEFNNPSAWDDIRIDREELSRIKRTEWDVFIYGTLAQRSDTSRKTLELILENIRAHEFFFDVNLRLSFYSRDVLENSLKKATILKMNDEEIPVICSMFHLGGIREIMDYFDIPVVISTYGKKGSMLSQRGKEDILVTSSDVHVVDTVGAGDSLSAAFLYFYSAGCEAGTALVKASRLADYVVSKPGAIPEYDDTVRKAVLSL